MVAIIVTDRVGGRYCHHGWWLLVAMWWLTCPLVVDIVPWVVLVTHHCRRCWGIGVVVSSVLTLTGWCLPANNSTEAVTVITVVNRVDGVIVAGVGGSGARCHCRGRGGDSSGTVVDVVNPHWGGHGGHHCCGWWLMVGAVIVAGGGGVVANVADSGGYCDCGHHCH